MNHSRSVLAIYQSQAFSNIIKEQCLVLNESNKQRSTVCHQNCYVYLHQINNGNRVSRSWFKWNNYSIVHCYGGDSDIE